MVKHKLSPILRKTLLEDMAREKPNQRNWEQWVVSKAVMYVSDPEEIKKYLTSQLELMDFQIQISSLPIAQKIASMMGASRFRAIEVLNQGLEATTTRSVRIENAGKEDQQYLEVTEPDFKERRQNAVEILKIYGGFAPQVHEVRHSIVEELNELTDEQIMARRAELLLESAPEAAN